MKDNNKMNYPLCAWLDMPFFLIHGDAEHLRSLRGSNDEMPWLRFIASSARPSSSSQHLAVRGICHRPVHFWSTMQAYHIDQSWDQTACTWLQICSVHKLWICQNQRDRMGGSDGVGGRHLALQPHHLRPARPIQVRHPLRAEQQGLEQSAAEPLLQEGFAERLLFFRDGSIFSRLYKWFYIFLYKKMVLYMENIRFNLCLLLCYFSVYFVFL